MLIHLYLFGLVGGQWCHPMFSIRFQSPCWLSPSLFHLQELRGERLGFQLLRGCGPLEGFVSLRIKGKEQSCESLVGSVGYAGDHLFMFFFSADMKNIPQILTQKPWFDTTRRLEHIYGHFGTIESWGLEGNGIHTHHSIPFYPNLFSLGRTTFKT